MATLPLDRPRPRHLVRAPLPSWPPGWNCADYATSRRLTAALRIRYQMLSSPGALGLSPVARSAHRTVWTLAAWQDPATLQAATGRQPHADHDAIPAAHRWLQLRHLDSPGHGPAHRMGRGAAPPA